MDLAHLQKIELGQRLPTEEQTGRLAKFFKLDETETQARRIAEKFQHEFAEHPAAKEAIGILAEKRGFTRSEAEGGRAGGCGKWGDSIYAIIEFQRESAGAEFPSARAIP